MSQDWRVMIACPAYAQMRPETAFALGQTYLRLSMESQTYVAGVFDCPSIPHARNRLVATFMATPDCTHLLMVDADMIWEPQAVLRLLDHDAPFVAVPGPDKRTGRMYVGSPGHGGGEILQVNYDQSRGLVKVDRVGACFMLIRRDCVHALMESRPDLWLEHQEIDEPLRPFHYAFFQTAFRDGWLPTEDFFFADRLKEAGIDVLVDAWIELGHRVPQTVTGKLLDFLEF